MPPVREAERPHKGLGPGSSGAGSVPHTRKEPPGLSSLITLGLPGGERIVLWSRPPQLVTRPGTCRAGLALAVGLCFLPITAWTMAERPGEESGPGLHCSWGTAGVGRRGGGHRGQLTHRPAPGHAGRLGGPRGAVASSPDPHGSTGTPLALSEIVRTQGLGVAAQGGPGVPSMAPSAARISWTLNQPTALASGGLGASARAGGL